jgi:glyceraldehyde 3-phosphate dehydrogenase
MAVKVGINGFGRIGRQVMKIVNDNYGDLIEIVAINSMRSPSALAHLLKYDSTYGTYNRSIDYNDKDVILNGKHIRIISGMDPSLIPWQTVGTQIVIEATGKFKTAEQVQGHFDHGVQKVIITAPGKGVDISVVPGVNQDSYDPSLHNVISCASCTTNCLAPIARVLQENFGIKRGFVSTVHAYTTSQSLLDEKHKDLRRARGALQNVIPSTTGASKAIGEVIPALKGRLDGSALRIPLPTVSLLDLTVELEKPDISAQDINQALKKAAAGELKGILDVCEAQLVSSDFKGTSYSAIVDAAATVNCAGLYKILAWYDNEWGYSCRIADLLAHVARKTFIPSSSQV